MDELETKINRKINVPKTKTIDLQTSKNIQWNEKLEMAAKDIGEASKSYKIMHIQEAQKANKIYNRLMIMAIIMGPLSGVTSGIGAVINSNSDSDSEINTTIPIIATILGFLAGIIVSMIKFGKYDEASNSNKQAAARYTSIESNVRRQLSLYRSDRVPATPYMEWLETKYEELFMSAPLLPAEVYDKYSHIAKNIGLRIPNQYDAIITINTEYEQTKVEEIINVTDIKVNDENKPNTDIVQKLSNNDDMKEDKDKEDKKIKRTNTMLHFPQLNQFSDKMLEYEMKRMMGFSQ